MKFSIKISLFLKLYRNFRENLGKIYKVLEICICPGFGGGTLPPNLRNYKKTQWKNQRKPGNNSTMKPSCYSELLHFPDSHINANPFVFLLIELRCHFPDSIRIFQAPSIFFDGKEQLYRGGFIRESALLWSYNIRPQRIQTSQEKSRFTAQFQFLKTRKDISS